MAAKEQITSVHFTRNEHGAPAPPGALVVVRVVALAPMMATLSVQSADD
jgi:hypothetical protein